MAPKRMKKPRNAVFPTRAPVATCDVPAMNVTTPSTSAAVERRKLVLEPGWLVLVNGHIVISMKVSEDCSQRFGAPPMFAQGSLLRDVPNSDRLSAPVVLVVLDLPAAQPAPPLAGRRGLWLLMGQVGLVNPSLRQPRHDGSRYHASFG